MLIEPVIVEQLHHGFVPPQVFVAYAHTPSQVPSLGAVSAGELVTRATSILVENHVSRLPILADSLVLPAIPDPPRLLQNALAHIDEYETTTAQGQLELLNPSTARMPLSYLQNPLTLLDWLSLAVGLVSSVDMASSESLCAVMVSG